MHTAIFKRSESTASANEVHIGVVCHIVAGLFLHPLDVWSKGAEPLPLFELLNAELLYAVITRWEVMESRKYFVTVLKYIFW